MATRLEQVQAAVTDRYRVDRQIGVGGMATIYLAYDRANDRKLALKVLNDELAATVGSERFLREIRVAARLTHPNILSVYESGEREGLLYYLMPFVEGETLRDYMLREGQLPIEEALRLAAEIGEALAHAHRNGIVHRDIKPENIMLSGGHAIVADFGIARVLGSDSMHITATGVAVGTPGYMSPEQACGEVVDARSDIYSLGCVLYEMLGGRPPFTGASTLAVAAHHVVDAVPPIRTVRADVSPRVAAALEKALAKVPADRFASADDFVAALRDCGRDDTHPLIQLPQSTTPVDTGTTARSEASTLAAYTPVVTALPVAERDATPVWPVWQRILFRFFFVYLGLQIAPWNWFYAVPGVPYILRYYRRAVDWAVHVANARAFHVRETLVPVNGSGDTSWAWTQLWLYLSLAAIACVVWTILDRRRTNYERLGYWLRTITRYYVASAALSYGIIKLFLMQMPFPALSQLATPLGDLLPMRFSWLFIGYSAQYQFFSGAMETVAGLLLLNRRTVTAGLFAATGAFMNVVMINMSYDVPVKLYASHLLFACLFLLALDSKRLVRFLVLNQTTPPTTAYDPRYTHGWQRWALAAVKVFIVFQILIFPLKNGWTRYQAARRPVGSRPFRVGVYDVRHYIVNRDTLSPALGDTLRWKDVIFDNSGAGSIATNDTLFWQRYHRGYFRYKADTVNHTVAVWKTSTAPGDSTFLFTMRYAVPDTNTIWLHTAMRGDSIHVELVRMPRHFQLTERQFHWLSEYNR